MIVNELKFFSIAIFGYQELRAKKLSNSLQKVSISFNKYSLKTISDDARVGHFQITTMPFLITTMFFLSWKFQGPGASR